MADDVTYTSTNPAGPPNATKQVTDEHATRGHMPVVKLAESADGSATIVDVGGLLTAIRDALQTIDNIVAGSEAQVDVVTVPAPLSTTGGGAEAAALRVTVASDSTGVLSVDDGGGSLTVDGTVGVSGTVPVSAASLPLPAGAATETSVAAAAAAAGGVADAEATGNGSIVAILKRLRTLLSGGLPAALGANGGLKVEGVASGTAVPVSGSVAATQSGTWVLGANSGVDVGDVTVNNTSGAGAVNIQDGGNSITVDGTVGVSGTVTVDSELPAAAALADNAANPTAPGVGAFGMAFDGTTWDRVRGDSTDGLLVNLGANNDVTVSGVATAANQATVIGHVDGIEALLTTIDADTSNLSVVGGGTEAAAVRVTIANNSTGVLSVDDNGGSLTVDGSVTANAGTNLNTSALAIESGGNLAAAAASLGVIDDWDETDRAKVNLIAGQAGVQGGSGAVSANTQRVVLATDVALPAGTNAIGKLSANSGVDIGDVDVTTVVPGTGATQLGKAVDSAVGATDTGVAALMVRDDVLATLTPADSDYTHGRTNSRGAQWTQMDAPPTGSPVLIARNIDVDESEDAIKASAGTLWGYFVANLSAATRFVKLYNATVATVVVGTTTPVLTLPIPAGASGHVPFPQGIPFDTAITVAATTGIADNDTGAPAANDVVFHGFYT